MTDKPIDTLRLSRRDREKLLDSMSRPDRLRSGSDVERRRIRVRFDVGRVFLALERSDGGCTKYSVTPRNLSSQGMAFIHGQFIHEDSRVEVVMPTLENQWVRTHGVVVSCRHIQGCVHEASVVFGETIDLERFVSLTPGQRSRADHEEGEANLVGRALVVDQFESDRKLLQLWLKRLGFSIIDVDDTAAALNMGIAQFDVILLDPLLHRDGWSVVQRMRQADIDVPIVGMSADDTDGCRAAALGAGCNAFIGKPWDPAMLRMVVEQLLLIEPTSSAAGPEDGPLVSTLGHDTEMTPLIQSFVGELTKISDELEDAVDRGDMGALRALCHHLKGAGAGYGFSPITDCARRAMIQFQTADPDIDVIHEKIDALVAMIHRARI